MWIDGLALLWGSVFDVRSILYLFAVIVIALVGALVFTFGPMLLSQYTSKLNNLPGPKSTSWIYGQMKRIHGESEASVVQETWVKEYGSETLMYNGLLNIPRLWTLDLRALNHILTHSNDYPKPEVARRALSNLLSDGLLSAEGELHRQQRRVMNPAFGPAQIRDFTETFLDKSIELRDAWMGEVEKNGSPARIDALSWLSRATLDIIGLAGFNYHFHSINPDGKPNELNEAFIHIFSPKTSVSVIAVLRMFFPIFRYVPNIQGRRVARAKAVMRQIGMDLIAQKKAEIAEEKGVVTSEKSGSMRGRDLLTLLLKANMATDIPDHQRMPDEDVLAQIPTFFVAGHETTSTATTWCLFALTQAPGVQTRLREELLAVPTDMPTMEELNELPYLDAVVRETLRLYAPVPNTMRQASKDDVIPVAEPFVDRHGVTQDSIRISAGDIVLIPIIALNRSKKLWGEDAAEFNPNRWLGEGLPEAVGPVPGVWGHMLTFHGGPRACIGYRFTLVEMKALIFTLVRRFEFELAVPVEDVEKKQGAAVQRPRLRSDPEAGGQLPLLVKQHHAL